MFSSSCVKPVMTLMIVVDMARGNIYRSSKYEEAYCTTSNNECILAGGVNGPDKTNHADVISRHSKTIEDTDKFAMSGVKELHGLIDNGPTFKIICSCDVGKYTQIFWSRFVDAIKNTKTGVQYKSRLEAQN